MASEQFRFHIPNLPKEIWHKFQELRKAYGLKQRQMIVMGVLAICRLGELDPKEVQKLVDDIKIAEDNNST